MVCSEDYESRHPQELLKVQREKIAVPWSRPTPVQDTFIEQGDGIITEGYLTNTDFLSTENLSILITET